MEEIKKEAEAHYGRLGYISLQLKKLQEEQLKIEHQLEVLERKFAQVAAAERDKNSPHNPS